MATFNKDTVAVFYEKRLNGSLLGRSVEDALLNWSGFSNANAACLHQLPTGCPLFTIVSCEWLGRGAEALICTVRSMHPTTRIILCCVRSSIPPLFTLLALLADTDPDVFCHFSELTTCLQTLMSGRSFVSTYTCIETIEHPDTNGLAGWNALSEQERKVIQLMAQGYKGPEIADQLFRSKYTVNNHRANIAQKLNVSGGPGSLIRFIITNREKILAST